jgi:hypothetical protein
MPYGPKTVWCMSACPWQFETVATTMESDWRRQQQLRCRQPGSISVADDVEGEAPSGADGAQRLIPDQRAVRELGHCLAAAGWVDLGLLLPTVCGDADGTAGILRIAAPQGYDRYDAYASGLLRFALGPTQGHGGARTAGSAAVGAEAERQVTFFLDRLTESSLPPGTPGADDSSSAGVALDSGYESAT